MATEQEWKEAYAEALEGCSVKGRYEYLYAGAELVIHSWLECPLEDRPEELPNGGDVNYFMDGYIADLDDEAGFSLWYEGGREALMEDENGKLPHIHTWFYWARFHEDAYEMNEHFAAQCEDKDMPLPQWYQDELDEE